MIINLNILTSQLRASKNIPSLISGLIPTIGTGPPFYYHKGGFCHYNRRRKEALAGPAPAGGGSGPKPGQGAKGKDTQTDSGRCNSGEGAAGNTEHGANGIGGILITKNTAEHLNCAKVSGKLEAFFFSRRAHLLTTSSSQSPLTSVSAFGENCGRSLAPSLPTKQALRGPLSAVVSLPLVGHARSPRGISLSAESDRQSTALAGFCCHRLRRRQIPCDGRRELWVEILYPCCRLPAQTCRRQLWRRDGRAGGPSIFSFAKEKQKRKNEVKKIWRFIIWK